jgi:6-phosphogluconolactonase
MHPNEGRGQLRIPYRLMHDGKNHFFVLTEGFEEQVLDMIFPRSAPRALRLFLNVRWAMAMIAIVLAGLALSCGGTNRPAISTHNAYISLPSASTVQLLRINDATGVITADAQTPPVSGFIPTGLALHPSKKFLYAVNSNGNSISRFNLATDGTLTINSTPTPAGSGPREAVIDPSGQYLLVTNTVSDNISVYSIDGGTGALTEVAGSPFFAHIGPTTMVITPSGKFVYVANPLGYVTGFSFSAGVLTEVAGSPFAAGAGVSALTVDATGSFLYTANTTANTVSGFRIDSTTGTLTSLQGSPYSSTAGSAPSTIAIDTRNTIVYVTTPGSSFSIWAFTIDPTTGVLTAVRGSPFNLVSGGGLFLQMEPRGNFFYVASQSKAEIAGFQYNAGSGTPTAITGSPFKTGSTPGQMVIVP